MQPSASHTDDSAGHPSDVTGDGADSQLQLCRLLGDGGATTGGPAGNVFNKLEDQHMLGSSTRQVYENFLLTKTSVCFGVATLAWAVLVPFGLLSFPLRELAPWSYELFLILVGAVHFGTTVQIFCCTRFLQGQELSKALDHCKESFEGPATYEDLQVSGSYFYEPKCRVCAVHCVFFFSWVLGFAATLDQDVRVYRWSGKTWIIAILEIAFFHFGNNGPRYVQALTMHISRKLLSQFQKRWASASDGSSEEPLWLRLRKEYKVMTRTRNSLLDAMWPLFLARMLTVLMVSALSAVASAIAVTSKSHGIVIAYGFLCVYNGVVFYRLINTADLPNILLYELEEEEGNVDFIRAGYSTLKAEQDDHDVFVTLMGRFPPKTHLFEHSTLWKLLLSVFWVLFHFACCHFQLDETQPFVAAAKDAVPPLFS